MVLFVVSQPKGRLLPSFFLYVIHCLHGNDVCLHGMGRTKKTPWLTQLFTTVQEAPVFKEEETVNSVRVTG